ncbi:hypothetical protein XH97_02825 [Bradyrhizobium sp. CCBAU 53380]|nr:hypothetical protein [Bradyrhizobium sp. CCBAU 53380]MDA9421083.1 hypothetical protein [Bradyrhizobium sp. CCBAU 53380]
MIVNELVDFIPISKCLEKAGFDVANFSDDIAVNVMIARTYNKLAFRSAGSVQKAFDERRSSRLKNVFIPAAIHEIARKDYKIERASFIPARFDCFYCGLKDNFLVMLVFRRKMEVRKVQNFHGSAVSVDHESGGASYARKAKRQLQPFDSVSHSPGASQQALLNPG